MFGEDNSLQFALATFWIKACEIQIFVSWNHGPGMTWPTLKKSVWPRMDRPGTPWEGWFPTVSIEFGLGIKACRRVQSGWSAVAQSKILYVLDLFSYFSHFKDRNSPSCLSHSRQILPVALQSHISPADFCVRIFWATCENTKMNLAWLNMIWDDLIWFSTFCII